MTLVTRAFASREDLGQGAWVAFVPGFVPDHAACMGRLVEELPLRVEEIEIFGKAVAMPRLTSWHGDPDAVYSYSRRQFVPAPWTADLTRIADDLKYATGVRFNSVLANYYRDGRDSMGAHADKEPELGPTRDNVVIASVSLGAVRRFVLAHKKQRERRQYDLGEGTLLVMGGTTQRYFRHWVPKRAMPVGPRLNLTFRVILRPPSAVRVE